MLNSLHCTGNFLPDAFEALNEHMWRLTLKIISGEALRTANLIVDAVYKGYRTDQGGIADPLNKLVGVSRQGGFRYRGTRDRPTLLVLTSNLSETEWPDELEPTLGRFVYWGDNRHPGHQLHDTPRFGNLLLQKIFSDAHNERRHLVPPILIFTREGVGRAFRFRGLAIPGYPGVPPTDDLVAIWKTTNGERFQNYRAIFTILDEAVIDRAWIHQLANNTVCSFNAPKSWQRWINSGSAKPLLAARTQTIRTKAEQLPISDIDKKLIQTIKERYEKNPVGFEACAGELTKILLANVTKLDLTRPWKDGGRDGIGTLRIGHKAASIEVKFALEAKCYAPSMSVGVREVSRLISRIKHREFGILVTTSFIDRQAYREVTDDGHPVIFITAADIVGLLKNAGYHSPSLLHSWLDGISTLN